MACKNLINYFLKTDTSADEGLLQNVERASAKAVRVLKTQGKTLSEVMLMAEYADSVEEVTSSFNLVNEVMLVFYSDLIIRNRFGMIKQCLKKLGVTARFAGFLQRASSLREALEEWKTKVATYVSNMQRFRLSEQRLNNDFDEELKRRLFSNSAPQAPLLKRPRAPKSPLLTMDEKLVHPKKVEKEISKKRRKEKGSASRDDRGKRVKLSSGRDYNKLTSRSLCFDYQLDKFSRGEKSRYKHIKSDC